MLPLDQLKQLVLNNVQKNGFLNHMRAELKLQSFKIIDGVSRGQKESAGFQWEHPQLSILRKMENGQLCLELIYEFLEFFRLDYTLDVFKKEVSIGNRIQRKQLESEINFKKTPDSSKALLQSVIGDYMHILENPSGFISTKSLIVQEKPQNSQQQPKTSNKSETLPYTSKASVNSPQMNASDVSKKDTLEDEKYNNSYDQSQSYDKKTSWHKEEDLDKLEQEEIQRKEQEKADKLKKEQLELEAQKAALEAAAALENEAKNKKKKRPESAPVIEEKKPPPTAVNKIRGGKSTSTSSLYGNLGGFGSATISSSNTGGFGFDGGMGGNNDPYGFDLDAELKPAKKDPYAFDLDAGIKDPYAFDLDDGDLKSGGLGFGTKNNNKNANKTKTNQYDFAFDDKKTIKGKTATTGLQKNNKFAGSSGLGDPSYNDDEEDESDGYAFQPKGKSQNKKNHSEEDDSNHYLDEDIDEFQDSQNRDQFGYKSSKKDSKNPMFTSSEDIVGASQSQGFDNSVQSEVIENYDYFEPVVKKK